MMKIFGWCRLMRFGSRYNGDLAKSYQSPDISPHFVGEWKDFFGLKLHLPLDAHFYQKIIELIKHYLYQTKDYQSRNY